MELYPIHQIIILNQNSKTTISREKIATKIPELSFKLSIIIKNITITREIVFPISYVRLYQYKINTLSLG